MSGVFTFGETMALFTTDGVGPMQHATGASIGMGGAESNFAIAVRRLGGEVTWMGKVGTDPLGDRIVRELLGEGLNVRALRAPEAPTSLMIKEHRTSNDTRVWYYRRGNAGSQLTPEELDTEAIAQADLLHITGISPALSESMNASVLRAIEVARDANVPISFDLNFRSKLWSREQARASYLEIIPQVDYVFAGDDEAAIAVGEGTPFELAHRLADLGPAEAVIKLGDKGAIAVVGGTEYTQDAFPVQVVDTVGAGDGFVAGYMVEAMRGEAVQARLHTAAAVGAYACQVNSDWEGLPSRDELGLLGDTEPVKR